MKIPQIYFLYVISILFLGCSKKLVFNTPKEIDEATLKEYYPGFKAKTDSEVLAKEYYFVTIQNDLDKKNPFDGVYDFLPKRIDDEMKSIRYNLKGTKYKIYLDTRLSGDNFEYYLEIEKNKHKTNYYLGITNNEYIHIKAKQNIPLIKNDSIQLQVALVKESKPFVRPSDAPTFSLVKDFLIIKMSLKDVQLDSDQDGFTDIEEYRLMLNPNSKDTDSDGINDLEDMNPRFKNAKTKKSKLYSNALDASNWCVDSIIIDDKTNWTKYNDGITHPIMVISDDPDLLGIAPNTRSFRYIFLTSKESEEYRKRFKSKIETWRIIFDKKETNENLYHFEISGPFWGDEFELKQINDTIFLKIIGGYVI